MNPAEAAKHTVEMGKKHVLDQQQRIARQNELIAKLERGGHRDSIAEALRLLTEMQETLAEMEAHLAAAHERLAQFTVDEPSLAKVERDCPM